MNELPNSSASLANGIRAGLGSSGNTLWEPESERAEDKEMWEALEMLWGLPRGWFCHGMLAGSTQGPGIRARA